jgi:hypothetical protein
LSDIISKISPLLPTKGNAKIMYNAKLTFVFAPLIIAVISSVTANSFVAAGNDNPVVWAACQQQITLVDATYKKPSFVAVERGGNLNHPVKDNEGNDGEDDVMMKPFGFAVGKGRIQARQSQQEGGHPLLNNRGPTLQHPYDP